MIFLLVSLVSPRGRKRSLHDSAELGLSQEKATNPRSLLTTKSLKGFDKTSQFNGRTHRLMLFCQNPGERRDGVESRRPQHRPHRRP